MSSSVRITFCRSCGQEIEWDEPDCPRCGKPNEPGLRAGQRRRRSTVVVLLSAGMLLSMVLGVLAGLSEEPDVVLTLLRPTPTVTRNASVEIDLRSSHPVLDGDLRFRLNGRLLPAQSVAATGGGFFSVRLDLAKGENRLTAEVPALGSPPRAVAFSMGGSKTRALVIGQVRALPHVVLAKIPEATSSKTLVLQGRVTSEAPLEAVRLSGTPGTEPVEVEVAIDGTFEAPWSLEGDDGVKTGVLVAVDTFGGTHTTQLSTRLDTAPPEILAVDVPQHARGESVDVVLRCDDVSGPCSASLVIDGKATDPVEVPETGELSLGWPLDEEEGVHRALLSVADAAGNRAERELLVRRVSRGPALTLEETPAVTRSNSFKVRGHVSSGAPPVELFFEKGDRRPREMVADDGDEFAFTWFFDEDGVEEHARLVARDTLGNESHVDVSALRDRTAPTLLPTSRVGEHPLGNEPLFLESPGSYAILLEADEDLGTARVNGTHLDIQGTTARGELELGPETPELQIIFTDAVRNTARHSIAVVFPKHVDEIGPVEAEASWREVPDSAKRVFEREEIPVVSVRRVRSHPELGHHYVQYEVIAENKSNLYIPAGSLVMQFTLLDPSQEKIASWSPVLDGALPIGGKGVFAFILRLTDEEKLRYDANRFQTLFYLR